MICSKTNMTNTYYCKTCSISVCSICIDTEEHAWHELVKLSESKQRELAKVDQDWDKVKDSEVHIPYIIQALQSYLEVLKIIDSPQRGLLSQGSMKSTKYIFQIHKNNLVTGVQQGFIIFKDYYEALRLLPQFDKVIADNE